MRAQKTFDKTDNDFHWNTNPKLTGFLQNQQLRTLALAHFKLWFVIWQLRQFMHINHIAWQFMHDNPFERLFAWPFMHNNHFAWQFLHDKHFAWHFACPFIHNNHFACQFLYDIRFARQSLCMTIYAWQIIHDNLCIT